VGKIYNIWASRLCRELVGNGIDEVHCQLASRIGRPITEPEVVHLAARCAGGNAEEELRTRVRLALDRLPGIWKDLATGRGLSL
jgi:S-adenosylmethionine synthetase